MSKIMIWLIIGSIYVKSVLPASIFPTSSLYINENDGMVVHLITNTDFGTMRECYLDFDAESYELYPNTVPHTSIRSEAIEGVSNSFCGVRIRFLSKSSEGKWTLRAVDEDLNENSATLTLQVLQIPEDKVVNYNGLPGSEVSFQCPGSMDSIRYCEIIIPNGNVIQTCFHTTKYPSVGISSIFKCKVMSWGKLEEVDYDIVLNGLDEDSPKVVQSEVIETANSVIISCKTDSRIRYCRAEAMKTGDKFLLMDGMQGERYSAYNTMTTEGVCQLEIPKPLLDFENGLWRIHMVLDSRTLPTGCVVDLASDTAQQEKDYSEFVQSLQTNSLIETLNETITIACPFAPFELDYCYLKTPVNEINYPSSFDLPYFKVYGQCTFNRISTMTGQYTCGYNSPDHSGDLFHHVDVKFHNRTYIEAEEESLSVKKFTPFHMRCQTVLEYGIKSCLFISPSGNAYHLLSNTYKTDNFSYFGKGLNEGDCGIEFTIGIGSDQDFGLWTCDIELNQQISSHYSLTIMVNEEREVVSDGVELRTGEIVGISAGVVVAAAFLGAGFIFYRRRHRRSTGDLNH